MKTTVLPIVAAFVISAGASVQAQQSDGRTHGAYSYGQRNYFSYHHASTAAEGYLRGVAAVMHAQGQYNRMTAEAMVAAEQARQLQIQNRELAASTRFSMQAANEQARAKARRPRITGEQAARLAGRAVPERPSPREVDPETGWVSWPISLQGTEFDQSRQRMESLLARRAASGQLGADDVARADEAVHLLLTILKGRVREMQPMQYTAAHKFAEQLAFEIRQPSDTTTARLAMVHASR